MTKVLKFKVEAVELEDKIWREIEITDNRTLADLAYTIILSFNATGDHLYEIRYKDRLYDCWLAIEDYHGFENPINAIITKLKTLNLEVNEQLSMEYDTGSTIEFRITYLGSIEFTMGNGKHYPYITNGKGLGVINDYSTSELKEIIEDIDKKGYSDYYYIDILGGKSKYNYKEFNIDKNILHIRRFFYKMKHTYEEEYYEDEE